MTIRVEDAKLIATIGEAHHELQPEDISVDMTLNIGNVEGQPQLVTVAVDLEVSARETGHAEGEEAVRWATIGARFAVLLDREAPEELSDDEFTEVTTQMWPYLRSQCLVIAAQLGIEPLRIPFHISEVATTEREESHRK